MKSKYLFVLIILILAALIFSAGCSKVVKYGLGATGVTATHYDDSGNEAYSTTSYSDSRQPSVTSNPVQPSNKNAGNVNEAVNRRISVPSSTPTPVPTPVQSSDSKIAAAISSAIQPSNKNVRAYALNAIKSSHSGNYNIMQICDIYDQLYRDWTYVNDPRGIEYFAPASESVRLLKGDCDDYAVLMASLIESIGGASRVICAHNANSGHAYAEVFMSKNKDDVQKLINNIGSRYGNVRVNYRQDSSGYWLNLDWTAKHPGGQFYESAGTLLAIRSNGNYQRLSR